MNILNSDLEKKDQWIVESLGHMSRIFDEGEVCIEFCVGDFCVGVYDDDENLLEPKVRCESYCEAMEVGEKLVRKYKKGGGKK